MSYFRWQIYKLFNLIAIIPKYKEGSVDSKTGEIYNNLSDKLEMVYKKIME